MKMSSELFRFCLAATILVVGFAYQIFNPYTNTATLVMLLVPTIIVATLGIRLLQKAKKVN